MNGVLRLTAALLCAGAAAVHAADIEMLSPGFWDRPRTARTVLDERTVRQALGEYLSQSAARLVIRHGLGQEPLVQAEELRTWLMALAVDGARISLISDAGRNDRFRIEVVK